MQVLEERGSKRERDLGNYPETYMERVRDGETKRVRERCGESGCLKQRRVETLVASSGSSSCLQPFFFTPLSALGAVQ